MILVFADDQTVSVFSDVASTRSYCEAVDVENGTYQFFDECGRRLKPHIITPVQRTSLPFGIKVIGGGDFDLEPDLDAAGGDFDTLLARTVAVEPNAHFATLADLERYVRENRRRC